MGGVKMNISDLNRLLGYISGGKALTPGTEMHAIMNFYSDAALKIVASLNSGFHSPAEIRTLMEELTGNHVPESVRIFPPFYSDFGKNIHLGENVFINSCCCFQDQGGIFIGSGALIGHRATIATINHGLPADQRGILYLRPVRIDEDVWLGSDVTILPGVTIGRGSIVAAGSVVTRDVAPFTIVAGNPARKIKDTPQGS